MAELPGPTSPWPHEGEAEVQAVEHGQPCPQFLWLSDNVHGMVWIFPKRMAGRGQCMRDLRGTPWKGDLSHVVWEEA